MWHTDHSVWSVWLHFGIAHTKRTVLEFVKYNIKIMLQKCVHFYVIKFVHPSQLCLITDCMRQLWLICHFGGGQLALVKMIFCLLGQSWCLCLTLQHYCEIIKLLRVPWERRVAQKENNLSMKLINSAKRLSKPMVGTLQWHDLLKD